MFIVIMSISAIVRMQYRYSCLRTYLSSMIHTDSGTFHYTAGCIKGIEYFKCPEKRGLMLRSSDLSKL